MHARLFVGHLSWNTSDSDLSALFAAHAEVVDATVISDRDTGRSRGFGFVTVVTENAADVIRTLDGQEINGRAMRVNAAQETPQRDRGGFTSSGYRERS